MKLPHWHVVLSCPDGVTKQSIAKWFDIPIQYVDVPYGRNAFMDCARYLTHEDEKQQALGKQVYLPEDVKASFSYEQEIEDYIKQKAKYGQMLPSDLQILHDITYDGLTLRQAREKDEISYMQNIAKYTAARSDYLKNAPVPSVRLNFYIDGYGGNGKSLLTIGLARSLFPEIQDDNDLMFTVGSENAGFLGYDGQPVIIFDDYRADSMIRNFGGRGNVFNILDPFPSKVQGQQNIKYGAIRLINSVNIINGIQPYKDFLDGLAGEYEDKYGMKHFAEDKNQSYRRMPFIICVHEDDMSFSVNKGFRDDNKAFTQYQEYMTIIGNMQKAAAACGSEEVVFLENQQKMLAPIVDVCNEIKESKTRQRTREEIEQELKDMNFGQVIYHPCGTPADEETAKIMEEEKKETWDLLVKINGEDKAQLIKDSNACQPLEALRREYRELERKGLLYCQLKDGCVDLLTLEELMREDKEKDKAKKTDWEEYCESLEEDTDLDFPEWKD